MPTGLSVRRAMERLHHKTLEQRQVVNEMRRHAEELTASGRAFAKAKHQNPPPLCFVEVAGEADLQRGFFPDGMLSGVAIGVSDALDVREFRTRYGAESQLLHQMPHEEFPFVSWLRRHGAQFVGKLACRTPLAIDEASVLVPDCPAAAAVAQNACNYSISSALIGPAAMTSPLHYAVAAFKPTAQSFATFTDGYHLRIPSMSVGITASRLDDIFYLWEVFTSAIQPASFLDEREGELNAGNATGNSSSHNSNNKNKNNTGYDNNDNINISNIGSNSNSNSGNSGISKKNNKSIDGNINNIINNIINNNNNNNNSNINIINNRRRNSRRTHFYDHNNLYENNSFYSKNKIIEPHLELSVGYPADWIDALCQERLLSGDEFRRRILRLASSSNATKNNRALEVTPLTIDVDLEAVVKATRIIALYELSQSFDRLFSPNSLDGRSSYALSGVSQSGVLDELPDELVSSIFHGRALTTLDYHRALRTRDSVVRATEEQFRDVDLIVTPILSEPYVDGSLRSIALLLPFSLGGNPMISIQLEPNFPVALIGELGRDTGLFEDSTTFLQFVRGTSPRWWRTKFMK